MNFSRDNKIQYLWGPVFVPGFSEINKRGGSNKACKYVVGKMFSKRIRKTPPLLETLE